MKPYMHYVGWMVFREQQPIKFFGDNMPAKLFVQQEIKNDGITWFVLPVRINVDEDSLRNLAE